MIIEKKQHKYCDGFSLNSNNEVYYNVENITRTSHIFYGGIGFFRYRIKNNIERLAEDHENAKYFAKEISVIDGLRIDFSSIETNIVAFETPQNLPASELVAKCKEKGLLFNALAKNKVRLVFHLDASSEDTKRAIEIMKQAFV